MPIRGENKSIEISLDIINKNPRIVYNAKELHIFNGKFYEPLEKECLSAMIFDYFVENDGASAWSPNKTDSIIRAIEDNHKMIKRVEFDENTGLMNLNNGIFNIKTRELLPHSPDYYFSYVLSVDYNPQDIACPYFTETIEALFKDGNGNLDLEDFDSLMYIGGYLLFPEIKMDKMFMFVGDGDAGKSIVIDNVYRMFIPGRYITSMSLNALADEESFSRAQIIGSRLNIATEQSGEKLNSEEIKKIVSGEPINIRKIYKGYFTYRPKMKVIVASNTMPYLNDTTRGASKRLFLVNFKNRFVKKEEYARYVKPGESRIFLAKTKEEIINNFNKEKTAIFNLFLTYLDKLKANDWKIPDTKNALEIAEEYLEESDPLGSWLKENYERDCYATEFGGTMVNTVFNEFLDWYAESYPGQKPSYSLRGRRGIGRRIKEIFRIDKLPLRRIGGDPKHFYPIKKIHYDDLFASPQTGGTEENNGSNGNLGYGTEDQMSPFQQDLLGK